MPPLLPIVAVLVGGGYFLKHAADAMEEMNEGAKLAMLGCGAYVSYQALKASGVIK